MEIKRQGKPTHSQGFGLLGLIIVIAIIALLWLAFNGKFGNSDKTTIQTGNQAIEQTKQNNAALEQQNLDEQNTINSISEPSSQTAIDQAKKAEAQENQQ